MLLCKQHSDWLCESPGPPSFKIAGQSSFSMDGVWCAWTCNYQSQECLRLLPGWH